MSRPQNSDTVNGVFNLNSLLEDLPQANSASAPSTPFPDGLTKAPGGRGLHAHHASLSSTPFSAFHNVGQATSPALGQRPTSVFDYASADQPRSAYRMPRVINTAVFNGQIRRGRCKFFNSQKGFGFINDGKPEDLDNVEVFVHFTAIASNGGFRSLGEGEECEYTLVPGPKGYQASNVTGPGGRPVVGDPKARAPMAKHAPPYMFVPPHGAHFYDPYHAHPSSYYPHSPYGQVMLSIVPTPPGGPYPMAHPAYQHTAVPAGSPYAAIPAAPPSNLPTASATPPVSAASNQQYLFSGTMGAGIPQTSRTSPFSPASATTSYSGLGLGSLASPVGVNKTPWQTSSGLGAIGGQRMSSGEAVGRYGSPSLPTTGVSESTTAVSSSALANDIFANGVVSPPPMNQHAKRPSGSVVPSSYETSGGGVSGRRSSSTAQELFDGIGGSPVKSSAATKPGSHRASGGGLSSASSLLYNSNSK